MGIRQPPSGIKDANLRGFLQELRNAINGVSDQVTKIIATRSSTGGGGNTPTDPANPGNPVNPVTPQPGDGYPPPPPTSLTATADIWSIELAWENPVISDYLGTEVWAQRTFTAWDSATRYYVNAKVLNSGVVYRAKKGNAATDGNAVNNTNQTPSTSPDWWEPTTLTVMDARVKVAEVAGTRYTFTGLTGELLTPGERWAFWVRNRDIENLYSTYFPDDDTGVVATTLLDPGAYIDLLTGSITESALYQGLGSRIDRIEDEAAYVAYKEEAKIGYCTIGSSISSHGTKKTCEDAGGTWNDQPFAQKVTQVGVTASNGETATVQEQMESVYGPDGLRSQYTLKVDVAGHVGGFGFATTPNNNSWTSAFGIRADQFFVAPPAINQPTAPTSGLYQGMVWHNTGTDTTYYYTGTAWSTTPQALPFVIRTSPTTINGESVPAGTYIRDAFIQNGVITSAKIGNAAITNAKIGNFIASTNFTFDGNGSPVMASTTGWCINKDGQAVFNNVRVRGDILLGGANLIQNSEGLQGLTDVKTWYTNTGPIPWTGADPTFLTETNTSLTSPAYGTTYFKFLQNAGYNNNFAFFEFFRPGSSNLTYKISVVAGRRYQFSADAYSSTSSVTVSLVLNWYDTSGYIYSTGGAVSTATVATRISVTADAAVSGGRTPVFVIPSFQRTCNSGTQNSTTWFSKVNFVEVPAGYPAANIVPWSPGGISLLDTLGLRANAATLPRFAGPSSSGMSVSTSAVTVTQNLVLPATTDASARGTFILEGFVEFPRVTGVTYSGYANVTLNGTGWITGFERSVHVPNVAGTYVLHFSIPFTATTSQMTFAVQAKTSSGTVSVSNTGLYLLEVKR